MPGNDILALDEVQTVLCYSHGHHQVFVSKLQFRNGSGQLSGYDMPRNVDPSVKKGVGLKQLAASVETCTRNRQFRAGLILVQQLKG